MSITPRAKSIFVPSGEERPEKLQKFQRNPFRGRIKSIKSTGKRSPSQNVTLVTYPRPLANLIKKVAHHSFPHADSSGTMGSPDQREWSVPLR